MEINFNIADKISDMIEIKLKFEDLIKKGLFSDVYRC